MVVKNKIAFRAFDESTFTAVLPGYPCCKTMKQVI